MAPDKNYKVVLLQHLPRKARKRPARVTGYVDDGEKRWWNREVERVSKLERLRRNSTGVLLARISKYGLKLDLLSLSRYAETHNP